MTGVFRGGVKVRYPQWLAAALLAVSLSSHAALPSPLSFSNTLELGDLAQAKRWLGEGLSPGFEGSRIGNGLMIGAWEGNLDMMRLFLGAGLDINAANQHGETALALAAWRNNRAAVDWLLAQGAKINTSDRQWSPLHYAVFSGHRDMAAFLVERGADINARSTNGSTVLMMAVYEGHADLAKMLVDKGADKRPRNDYGDGAMEWSMRYGRHDIAKVVSTNDEYAEAINQPKEKWGEGKRSMRMSRDLRHLMAMRDKLMESGRSVASLDKRISVERMRIVRDELAGKPYPEMMTTFEVTASRAAPALQSARLVTESAPAARVANDSARAGTADIVAPAPVASVVAPQPLPMPPQGALAPRAKGAVMPVLEVQRVGLSSVPVADPSLAAARMPFAPTLPPPGVVKRGIAVPIPEGGRDSNDITAFENYD